MQTWVSHPRGRLLPYTRRQYRLVVRHALQYRLQENEEDPDPQVTRADTRSSRGHLPQMRISASVCIRGAKIFRGTLPDDVRVDFAVSSRYKIWQPRTK